jgi:hypothetical protein
MPLRRAFRQLTGPFAIAGLVAFAACRASDAGPDAAAAAPAPAPVAAASGDAREVACEGGLAVGVVGIRRETADSIRVDFSLANRAKAGAPAASSNDVEAAVKALEEASVLTADGRRRMFALKSSSGQRLGTPAEAPPPGAPRTFWAVFPAAAGPVSLLLPGCAPLTGLAVAPAVGPGRPEP